MSRPIIDSLKTIFIHVPKTGGISIDRYFRENYNLVDFTGHHSASEIKVKFPENFDNYFKFAFVRNPWERLASAFFFLDQGGYSKIDAVIREKYLLKYAGNFSDFVLDLPNNLEFVKAPTLPSELGVDGLPFPTAHFVEQAYWICDNDNKILVDFVGRFENLQSDFEKICKKLELQAIPLQKLNSSKHDYYRNHYNHETASIVERLYARDINLWGYNF